MYILIQNKVIFIKYIYIIKFSHHNKYYEFVKILTIASFKTDIEDNIILFVGFSLYKY